MKYIDATLALESGMPGVISSPAKTLEKHGWNAANWQIYTHAGTHMDAPVHVGAGTGTIDKLSPDRFFVSCHLVDLNGIESKTAITVTHLRDIPGKFKRGEGLIIKTGWHRFLGKEEYRSELPRISRELAVWCIGNGVGLIAVEPPSVADVNNIQELQEIHSLLLGAGIIVIEGLANLDEVTQPKLRVVAFPLKLKDGDGSPCRVILIEE